ncbi:MAG: orotidine-5'-phosphate decarboxylase, partial [Gemmatimonadota bacterium]|nr:orotidine-5'-phosphate decarboxylase [Gemmatimonadota bacterium]
AMRDALGDDAGLVKLGPALFVREGMPLVRALQDSGVGVFLDLKLHDIPSVVARAAAHAAAEGVRYLTVHASGGAAMVEEAATAADAAGRGTSVLAVTVLTSLDLAAWRASASPDEETVAGAVGRLARLAIEAGAHGLVGSAREASILRSAGGPDAWVVTPGITMPGSGSADQARTVTPAEAVASGADVLVVGRGVTRSENPREALRSIRSFFEEVAS